MVFQKAFLMSYYNVYNEKLKLYGRVLSTLQVGDVLFPVNYNRIMGNYGLMIEKINAYRYEFNEISEGMTCELIVQGNDLNFKEDCVFYIIT